MALAVRMGECNLNVSELSEDDLEYLVYKKELIRRRELRGRRY